MSSDSPESFDGPQKASGSHDWSSPLPRGQYPPPGDHPSGGQYPGPGSYPSGPPGYQPQPYSVQPPPIVQQPLSPNDQRLWSTLSHISIPFFGVVGPLIAYLLFKDRGQFVRTHAVESLNFSILYTVAQFVSGFLTVLLVGFVLLPIVLVGALVLCILAAIAANKGELYRYPVNWRLVS